jgi:hypothetical protein
MVACIVHVYYTTLFKIIYKSFQKPVFKCVCRHFLMIVFCRLGSKHPLSLWYKTCKSGTHVAHNKSASFPYRNLKPPPLLVESSQMYFSVWFWFTQVSSK